MTPAQILTYFFGILLALTPGVLYLSGWFHVKVLLVLGLSAFHGFCIRWHRQLGVGHLPFAPGTFRLLNEIPTVLLIGIVFMVILKPF